MLHLLLVALLLSSSLSQSDAFQQWKTKYSPQYASAEEEAYRTQIFSLQVVAIQNFNSDPTKTWIAGINKFSDRTDAEFAATYLVSRPEDTLLSTVFVDSVVNSTRRNLQVNTTVVDWVALGKVSPVKDMVNCGASWAFASAGAIESGHLIKNGSVVSMSEQQVMDCTLGNCTDGQLYYIFNMSNTTGVNTTTNYPYLGYDVLMCRRNGGPIKISNFLTVVNSSCSSFNTALTYGPFPVLIEASNLKGYESGVVTSCGTTGGPNFYMLLVGINDSGWTLKNSWSIYWGDAGFLHLAPGNTCYICNSPTYRPVI